MVIGYMNSDYEVSYVHALASVSDEKDKLSLFVINLHPEDDIEAPVYLEGFQRKSTVRIQTISGDAPGTNNEPEDCPSGECVTTKEEIADVSGNPYVHRFPKHSVTVLSFSRVGLDEEPPADPSGLEGLAGDNEVSLFWAANGDSDLGGYNVYRSRCRQGPWQHRINDEPISATEYSDTSVDNDVTYTYAIKAVDEQGNESDFSGKVVVTPSTHPEDPGTTPGEDNTAPSPPILIQAG